MIAGNIENVEKKTGFEPKEPRTYVKTQRFEPWELRKHVKTRGFEPLEPRLRVTQIEVSSHGTPNKDKSSEL